MRAAAGLLKSPPSDLPGAATARSGRSNPSLSLSTLSALSRPPTESSTLEHPERTTQSEPVHGDSQPTARYDGNIATKSGTFDACDPLVSASNTGKPRA